MDNNELIDQTVQDLAASSTNSVTAAGPVHNKNPARTDHLVDAINQVFALFRINYHNQFYSAYADTELLNQAKRLWLESLSRFSETQILSGAKKVIETSDYLPTLNRMIQSCEEQYNAEGLPSPYNAYLEACNASSPKAAAKWSHLAVYYAGAETGWYRLSHEAEATSFPAYRENYRRICRDVAQGKSLEAPNQTHVLEEDNKPNLSKDQSLRELARLKETLGFG